MHTDRRKFLGRAASGLIAPSLVGAASSAPGATSFKRIATEEAFATPDLVKAWLEIARSQPDSSLDVPTGILSIFGNPRPGSNQDRFRRQLLDKDDERLGEMDRAGVDMQVLSVTIPGVQVFDAGQATELSVATNDHLAAVIARHPKRYAGLACFASQDPRQAALEMERAISKLGLNGFIVNSHTNNLYLDDARFAPILEAAQALDRPIYLHPRAPSKGMEVPFREYSMGGSIWGFGVEAGTHAVRMILGGVFDRFPRLRVVLGHMGEGLPFWMWRLDHMATRRAKDGRMRPLALAPSEYFRRNFLVTTSGFESPNVLALTMKAAGIDNVMWAVDYPYEEMRDAVAFIEGAGLSEAERASIFHRNAERVFRID